MDCCKAYKYRFYPTKEQKENLAKTFGCTRYVYNWALALKTKTYEAKQENISYKQSSSKLTELKKQPDQVWLNDVSSVPIQQALRHLDRAFLNFFKKRAKYPNFKKRTSNQSAEYTKSAFKFKDGNIKLAKMKKPLKIKWSGKFKGKPTTLTISKDASDRYFVSILVKEIIKKKRKTKSKIGIDLGIKDICVTSNNFRSGNPRHTKKYEKKLAKLQKDLARKKKGSNNRIKAKLKVAKTHAKIKDCRNDFSHKLSTKLINENQVIAVENLTVKNMIRNHKLAKHIADANWGNFLRMLEYKAEWYGRTLVKIDKWYPSSKQCSACGYTMDKLPLNIRKWECPRCKNLLNRDLNAAKNILAVGQTVLACGEKVSLVLKAS